MRKNPVEWEETLHEIGAIWKHDGHPERPYARLTSERISDRFIDLSFLMTRPKLVANAANELAEMLLNSLRREYGEIKLHDVVICGQMVGSVTLASRIAEVLNCGFIFTQKLGEGKDKEMVVDERFVGMYQEDALIILVEDVTTTLNTSKHSSDGLHEFGFTNVSTIVLSLVDRTDGAHEFGFEILSRYVPEDFSSWEEGQNPHTPNGQELVPPVRAKKKAGRIAMRRAYT